MSKVVATQQVGSAGRLQLKWSKYKKADRLVAHLDEPGFKQQTKWLSIDEPALRLAEVVQGFESLNESDITNAFKMALLTGESAAF
eukprot:7377977-Prymnesium_polylepis.2